MPSPLSSKDQIERVVREEWGRILSIMVKTLGDFQFAEDYIQNALIAAMTHWDRNGLPRSPAAWLLQVARRKAIDRLRRDKSFANKEAELSYLFDLENIHADEKEQAVIPDERLQMIFVCCHPALAEKSRVALTLRALGGLNTDQIAAAFLDSPDTMRRRITRAKQKIAGAGIPYKVPETEDLPVRLASVLRTLYLVFNEGYSASSGRDLTRVDLSNEAIRLARITARLMPESCEVQGLLALMLLHDARRHARVGPEGELIALENQNRARWNADQIKEGTAILEACLVKGEIGPYQIQAVISGVHGVSADWGDTDWAQIIDLYGLLYRFEPTPVVRLNQAVALCMDDRLEPAEKILNALAELDDMQGYLPFHLARAELFQRMQNSNQAHDALSRALECSQNEAEATFIRGKLSQLLH